VTNAAAALVIAASLAAGCDWLRDQHWEAEVDAQRSDTHPLGGFWKNDDCSDEWGLAIGPMTETTYYLSFCGPGGCFEKGTYRPETKIVDDPAYKVINADTIEVKGSDGFSRYVRCPSRALSAQQQDAADKRRP
jgi:hypothetical protein